MVEFAGDFVRQNPDGVVPPGDENAVPDGVTDFLVEGTGANAVQKVRWYGFPRDTNDDGTINVKSDVVPVRDVARLVLPFERVINITPANGIYGDVREDARYVTFWSPDSNDRLQGAVRLPVGKPTMLRITIVLDDPASRIGEGQTFEYVVKVQ
jgi:hypothetical protein